MANELTLKIRLGCAVIRAAWQPQLVYLLLDICPASELGTLRLPINLSLVVDRSQSMCIPILQPEQFAQLARRGQVHETLVDGLPAWQFETRPGEAAPSAPSSLDYVKTALHSALAQLGPQDRYSLVAFADEARVLVSNQAGGDRRSVLQMIEQLEGLDLGNATLMGQGMACACAEAEKSARPGMASRMVILTDGFAADGDECIRQARRIAGQKVAISTVGLGVEFNEELLIGMADLSQGNAYFVHDPQSIPDVFGRELNGARAIVLRDLELKLRLTRDVRLRRAYRVQPAIARLEPIALDERSASVALGDMQRDVPQALLLELVAPPRPAGQYRLAQAVLAYNNRARGSAGEKLRADIVVEYAEAGRPGAACDPQVMNIVGKISAHNLQTHALQDARAGNLAGATARLRAAYTRLLDVGEQALAQTALQEIDNLQREGHLSAAGTKRLRYETRRLTDKAGGQPQGLP